MLRSYVRKAFMLRASKRTRSRLGTNSCAWPFSPACAWSLPSCTRGLKGDADAGCDCDCEWEVVVTVVVVVVAFPVVCTRVVVVVVGVGWSKDVSMRFLCRLGVLGCDAGSVKVRSSDDISRRASPCVCVCVCVCACVCVCVCVCVCGWR